MKYIRSDLKYNYFEDYFNDTKILWRQDKRTKEMLIDSESVAHALGFNTLNEMLLSNKDIMNTFLDGINNGQVK